MKRAFAFVGLGLVACGTLPFKGDTGIKPFAFDLWDLHCPSGLRIIFERAPGARTAGVTAVVGTGSIDDPTGREGLAHLVEHLTFRARHGSENSMRERLWSLGASHNAETDYDETTYHELVPGPALLEMVALEGARLADPLAELDEATFAVEKDVVRNELRERNETHSFAAAYQAAYQTTFPEGHPYRRPVVGTHDSLTAVTLDDARRFVAKHYKPDNITMVIAGDVDLARADEMARKLLPPALYGDPAHARPVARPPAVAKTAPALPPPGALARTRAPVTTPELWIAWSLPGGHGPEQDMAQMWTTLTRQNFHRGRFDDHDIGDVQLFTWPGVEGSIFICRVELTEGSHPEKSIREVVDNLPWIGGDELYLEHRFRGLKLADLRGIAFSAESVIDRSRSRAAWAHLTGGASVFGAVIEQVKSIDSGDARRFAERYLTAERARAVFVEPLAADARPPRPIPAAQDFVSVRRIELSDSTLANLAGVHHLEGLRTSKLGNGLQLIVLPRPGAPVVTATLAFHGDRATAGTGLPSAANEALDLMLEESPSDFGISYGIGVGLDQTSSTVRAGAGNLERALDMLAFGTRSLDFDWPSPKFLEAKVPLLKRHEASPRGRASRALWKDLFGAHPFGAVPTVDQIAAHKSGELSDWLGRIIVPANGALVIVGDVDVPEAESAARGAFSGLGGSGPALAAPPPVPPVARPRWLAVLDDVKHVTVTHRPGATQAELELRCLLPPVDARGDAAHDVVADLIEAALWNRLREESGSTYGTHVWATTLRGGTSMLTLAANVDNGRLPLALTTLRRFWRNVVKEGVSSENLRQSRDALASHRLMRYESSSALASELIERWNQGWPLTSIDDAPAYFASVTEKEVDEALKACASNLVFGIVGDEGVIRGAFATPAAVSASAAP